MKVLVSRTSLFLDEDKPCDEAIEGTYIHVFPNRG
jgi:hypothetical protein